MKNMHIASIVSSDPMRSRRDAIEAPALLNEAATAIRVGLEHTLITRYSNGYHDFTTSLNTYRLT